MQKEQKKIYSKIQYGYQKRRISHWLRIRWKSFEKMHHKKLLAKMWRKKSLFSLFTHVRQTFFAYNFFLCIFLQLFQRIRNHREILRFLISFLIFCKKKFFGVILALFANFEAERAKNGSKNLKKVFSKCVLDFNFAPLKGSVFFNLKKKIRCTLVYIVYSIPGSRECAAVLPESCGVRKGRRLCTLCTVYLRVERVLPESCGVRKGHRLCTLCTVDLGV